MLSRREPFWMPKPPQLAPSECMQVQKLYSQLFSNESALHPSSTTEENRLFEIYKRWDNSGSETIDGGLRWTLRARENIVTEHVLNTPEYLLFWRSSTVHQPGWSAAQEPSLPSSMKSWRNAREKQSHTIQKHGWQRHCNNLCVMKCKEHGQSS